VWYQGSAGASFLWVLESYVIMYLPLESYVIMYLPVCVTCGVLFCCACARRNSPPTVRTLRDSCCSCCRCGGTCMGCRDVNCP